MKFSSYAGSLFIAAFLLAGSLASAQNFGFLQGQVSDPSGGTVPQATVEIREVTTGATRSTLTGDNGLYVFSQLSPGTYTARVTKEGFKTLVREDIRVLVATPTTQNMVLQVGGRTETVTVTAEAPQLDTTDATVGNPFGEKDVKTLPFLARNAMNLLTLQPGVIFTGESDTDKLTMGTIGSMDIREGAVNGVRGNQSNVTVDGVDSNDWQNQAAFASALPVTLDSMQEYRVTTTNSNATEGTAGGAQVALVTKSGSNEFHGNVRWYYRTTGPTANSYFNNLDHIGRPKLLRNIAGGSLGGRIVKDRVYFFLDNEERRESSGVTAGPRSVPTDTLRDGVLIYACSSTAACPGGVVQGLTGPHAVPPGSFGLSPGDVKAIDPAGLGVNPAMLQYMGLYPHGNDATAGLDGGLNFVGYRFNAPVGLTQNIYISRWDFNLDREGRHTIFWRGSLQGLKNDLLPEQFPGQPVTQRLVNGSRGMAVQYQGLLAKNLINTFRWGFTRLGVDQTGQNGPEFGIRNFDENISFTRGSGRRVPVNEFKDDLSWVKGAHTVQLGGLIRFVRNNRLDDTLAFPQYLANSGYCIRGCGDAAANVTSLLNDPALSSTNLFTAAYMMLAGSITQVSATLFADPHTNSFYPPGATERRSFAEHDFEFYGQDTWRFRPQLTFTAGLRYDYETPPWEVNGFQVTPTTDVMQWWFDRVQNLNQGIPASASPLLSWTLAGRANGKPSWYEPDRRNFAPRLALAWSPDYKGGFLHDILGSGGTSSIRAGFGVYYNRIGEALAVDSDINGSPGTSTFLINPSGTESLADAPRFSGTCNVTGCTGLPPLNQFLSLPTEPQFPFTPAPNSSNLGFFIDPHLKTPYSMNFTFDVQRQLPKKLVLDVGYVGTLGRRLLGKVDIAQYSNLRNPKSGLTLWQAYNKIADIIGPNFFSPNISPTNLQALKGIKSIPYFDDTMSNMPKYLAAFSGNGAYANLTPTQAFYSYVLQELPYGPDWSTALYVMDTPTLSGMPSPWSPSLDPNGTGFVLFTPQWSTLPGWTNWGSSNYHSLQVSVRRTVGLVTFSANYVFSKSIDNTSSTENADLNPQTNGLLSGLIQNPFDLRASRALSDFNLKHNFNGMFEIPVPFGRGQRFASNASRPVNALISGWEITGVVRWRSGFPLSVQDGFLFPTNYFDEAPGTLLAPVKTHVIRNGPGGVPNLFSNRDAVLNDFFAYTRPGGSGSRNTLTSPAYAAMDAGVYKSFKMSWSEKQRLQLRVTAFNVFNNVNFSTVPVPIAPGINPSGIHLDPTSPTTFGQLVNTAGPRGGAREMEFAVRYEF